MEPLQNLPVKLDFEGSHNFRELGGYPTVDGGSVKPGRLFRSDHLGRLTDADQLLLAELGIRTVIDLRRVEEREEILDRIDDPAVNQVWLPVAAEGADVTTLRREMEKGTMGPDQAQDYLINANRAFIRVFSHVFKDFMHMLLDEDNYPIVFHCSAGKDRAGFAAALSLLTVGVSMESVMHDYLATNHLTANYVAGVIDGLSDIPTLQAIPDAVRTLMQVKPLFIQTAFDTAVEDYGSIDAFIEQALDFDEGKRRALRTILCE
jgi:protein-tyrosine phosphatase